MRSFAKLLLLLLTAAAAINAKSFTPLLPVDLLACKMAYAKHLNYLGKSTYGNYEYISNYSMYS